MHCRIWDRSTQQELDPHEIDRIFRAYDGFRWIDLTGGEVFLRKDIADIAAILQQHCRRLEYLHFPTNGLCNGTRETIEEIRQRFQGNLVITVSIDGPEEVNDEIRGSAGAFQKSVGLLKSFLEDPLPNTSAYAGMTVVDRNRDRVADTVSAIQKNCPSFTASNLHVNLAHKAPFYNNADVPELVSDPQNALQQIPDGSLKYGPFGMLEKAYRDRLPGYLKNGRCPLPCRSGEVSVFLDPQGRLYPCTMWGVPGIPLRDNEYDLCAALDLPDYRGLVEKIRKGQCAHCWTPCEAYQTILSSVPGLLAGYKTKTA